MLGRIESWLPRKNAAVLRQLARDTDRVLSAWLRGQLLCCAALGVFYAVALQLVGLELGLTIGLMAGILTFIPYVGSLTGFASAVLLAMGQFGTWNEVMMVVAIFVVGQTIEGYVIYPDLLGDRVELHAVWVIFALFAGGVAFGFLGVLLAVPMAAALGVVARYWLRRYLESPLYLDPPRTGMWRGDGPAPNPAPGGARQFILPLPLLPPATAPISSRIPRMRRRWPGSTGPMAGRAGGWRCSGRKGWASPIWAAPSPRRRAGGGWTARRCAACRRPRPAAPCWTMPMRWPTRPPCCTW